MDFPGFRRRRAAKLGAAARAVAQRTPQTLMLVRHRAQPVAVTIARLTCTAVFAYLLALLVTSTPRPVLAPLTALLVVQVSLYQTLRSAVTRAASVVAGVLVAVALAIGYALRLRENTLEVPITAMLILSVGTRAAATGRIIETFAGTAAGLLAGFVLTPPRVQSGQEAIEDLCAKMSGLLGRIATGLSEGSVAGQAGEWLRLARSLGSEIRRVDEALRRAEDSVRMNPRGAGLPLTTITLRESLETLEHETTAVRVLARSLADLTRLRDPDNPLTDPAVRDRLAGALRELSAAVTVYGALTNEADAARRSPLEAELERRLAAAGQHQDRLSELLGIDPAARPVGWPLRGELISHLDRLRRELDAGKPAHLSRRRARSLRRPLRAGARQSRSPARARLRRLRR